MSCLLLLNLAAFAIAGFWPFNFRQRNLVQSPSGGDCIVFGDYGIVFTARPFEPQADPGSASQSFSIELLLEPELDAGRNLHHILSLYDGRIPENLLISQWKDSLILRTAVRGPGGRSRYRETGVDGVLVGGVKHLITVSAGAAGTSYYCDGRLLESNPRHRPEKGILRGRLALGNSVHGHAQWRGKFYGAALFERGMTGAEVGARWQAWSNGDRASLTAAPGLLAFYFFGDLSGELIRDLSQAHMDLVVPARFTRLSLLVLEHAAWDLKENLSDNMVNLLGFIPLGFLIYARVRLDLPCRRWSSVLVATGIGLLVSVGIEVIQVWLPPRDSSLRDVMTNTLGTLCGTLLSVPDWLKSYGRNDG